MNTAKPFTIPKRLVHEAFKAVKANAGSAGVDQETIEDFEADLKNNLYRIWNRMSSEATSRRRSKRWPFRRRMAGNVFSACRYTAHNTPHTVCVGDWG